MRNGEPWKRKTTHEPNDDDKVTYFHLFSNALFWAAGWMIGGFESRKGIFFFTVSIPSLGLTQPPIQWTPEIFSWGKAAGA
jgi:hypothetical protein